MSIAKEFREFAVKGNVMDLAVGVIIGAAFGKIVDSLVKDLIMPVIGRIIGGLDFSSYFILLSNPNATAATVTLTFLLDTGATVVITKTVPANARLTVGVEGENPLLANAAKHAHARHVAVTVWSAAGRALIADMEGELNQSRRPEPPT
mgnify:CR=1 FL=1